MGGDAHCSFVGEDDRMATRQVKRTAERERYSLLLMTSGS